MRTSRSSTTKPGWPAIASSHHLQAQLRVGNRPVAVRRIAGRQESNLLEPQCLLQLERGAQMRIMDGIEGAAEYAHRIHDRYPA